MAVTDVLQFYRSVIDDVVNSIRETFLDDGVDEQVLLELKQVWENKLVQSKAVPSENTPVSAAAPPNPPPPPPPPAPPSNPPNSKTDRSVPQSQQQQQQQQQQFTTISASTQPQSNLHTTNTAVVSAAASHHHHHQTTNVVHSGTRGTGAGGTPLQYHYTTTNTGQQQQQQQQNTGPGGTVRVDASKSVTFTLPQTVVGGSQKPVTITLPPHLMQTGLVMSSPAAAAAQALPTNVAAGLLQNQLALNPGSVITQHQTADGSAAISYQTLTAEQLAKQGYVLSVAPPSQQTTTTTPTTTTSNASAGGIIQLDGANDDTSDDDDDDDDFKDENDDDDEQQNEDENEGIGEEEEPLNSEDDVSDEDPSELFDTDNVIVCQYDKITRSRNKWKFHLKDGIMNLQGRDFIFQKASGDAEW